ncbi:UNVERIFIED_CONTAM: Palmitoyl-acyl carrier protein thioesterase, chloroplastic [Sesamum calycinum]|uniref:Palmitoyl-acyl carrier protein thioesterase, chloroplastic n=1 Tax=Sesamum calycinum TaxID=2727403 RepID=A0AAW2NFL1_9LAMI
MALMRNAAPPFPQRLVSCRKKPRYVRRVGCAGGTRRRAGVKMKASSKTNVDTVNGKKVNGVHVEGRIPFLDQRSAELLKDGESVYGAVEPNHEYLLGRFVEDRFVYRQSFVIRSYEIGPDKTATMETLMNLLQGRCCGDRHLVDAAGKNGMRRDWIIRDYNTQKIITRATRAAIATENTDSEKIEKLTDETAEIIRTGLAPRWSDMDANQHVNNVKYIGWLLESVPINVLEDYNMTRLTLEYRRECRQSNVLESLTSMKAKTGDEEDKQFTEGSAGAEDLECTHLLRMEADQAEIVRARSVWQIKQHDDNQMT